MKHVDIVVVGAGHAGCEAALAASRLGARVALVTLREDRIAHMPCNPAVGGVGKGHLVKEIDALGGAMGRIADRTGIQFRRLNASRGPAVRSTRCQSDSSLYQEAMAAEIARVPGIELIVGEALSLERNGRRWKATLRSGHVLGSLAVVVTTGTFLNGLCHIGDEQRVGGRIDDEPARALSSSLRALGVQLSRFKTGTTPRLAADSIDWSSLEEQRGDDPAPRFSFDHQPNKLRQISCFVTATNPGTHEIIRGALDRSPLFTGVIEGLGPRYCPSIEDKVVRFSERDRHQIFLEPEGLSSERVYPNGISTSLPRDVQERFVRSIEGLQRAEIVQPGYAVEYDYAQPTQLMSSLMVRAAPGLFLAGQINGTSGYEEAGAQGLMAGLNAARWASGAAPAVIGRHQGYIGVLIDDLVTKGVDEPYRMFTSRAEHRLTLRESNAEERLLGLAREWGLVDAARAERAAARRSAREALHDWLLRTRVGEALCRELGIEEPSLKGVSRADLLRRPEIGISTLVDGSGEYDPGTLAFVEEAVKYEGYIERESREIARIRELENLRLPPTLRYAGTPGLSRELQDKLEAVQPETLGQASRIPGMTPAAIAIIRLRVHMGAAAASRPGP